MLGALALALVLPTAAPPSTAALTKVLSRHRALAEVKLPAFDAEQIADLRRGEVVRVLLSASDQGGGVAAVLLVETSMRKLWVASKDRHLGITEEYREHRFGPASNDEVWFGYLELPWPFSARHMRLRMRADRKLATTSRGTMWSRNWTLVTGGAKSNIDDVRAGRVKRVPLEKLEDAIYTPENSGAWMVLEVDKRWVLLGYRAETTAGGVVPKAVAVRLSMAKLEQMLREIALAADNIHTHYVDDHELVLEPTGQTLPRFDAAP